MPAIKDTDRLIDAISSLKRAAFIENVLPGTDHWKDGQCVIYTETKDSSDILKNLLGQAFSPGHLPPIAQTEHEHEIFEIRFPVSRNSCKMLTEQVEKLTQKLIAPDQTRRR
jgi:hypothetical protein